MEKGRERERMEGKTLQHAIIIITTIIITRSNIRLTHTQTGHQEEEEEAVPAEEGRTGGRGVVASTEGAREKECVRLPLSSFSSLTCPGKSERERGRERRVRAD